MINQNLLSQLDENENLILYFILNCIYPTPNIEINQTTIKSYKKPILDAKIKSARQYIKDENIPIFENLCKKLQIV